MDMNVPRRRDPKHLRMNFIAAAIGIPLGILLIVLTEITRCHSW
jgi:hypothetical protein